jgi:hypothetical protein
MNGCRLEFAAPEFFAANPKRLKIEDAGTGRIWFLLKGRIVAVGVPK